MSINPVIINISGKAGHGKDTLADFLKDELEFEGFKVQKIAFADALKQEAKDLGWNGEKDNNGRVLLQILGELKRRLAGENYWVKKAEESIKPSTDFVLLADTRYPNEIEYFEENYETEIAIRIIRYDEEGAIWTGDLTPEQKAHSSEVSLDDYEDFNIFCHIKSGEERVKRVARFMVNDIHSLKDRVNKEIKPGISYTDL